VREILQQIEQGLKAVEGKRNDQLDSALLDIAEQINACKSKIREFELEARADGVDAAEIKTKKQDFVTQINSYIGRKKRVLDENAHRDELLKGAQGTSSDPDAFSRNQENMSNQELMQYGRDKVKLTDDSIERSKRIVQDAVQVGTETAVKLQGQTEQMEKIVEDLDQIHFSLKKARVLVRDIVRQLATDKCIMAFLGLIAIGVVAIIMFKVFKPDKSSGPAPPGSEVVSTDNRRLLAGRSLLDIPTAPIANGSLADASMDGYLFRSKASSSDVLCYLAFYTLNQSPGECKSAGLGSCAQGFQQDNAVCNRMVSKYGGNSFFEPNLTKPGRRTLVELRSIIETLYLESTACVIVLSYPGGCKDALQEILSNLAHQLHFVAEYFKSQQTQVPDLVLEFARLKDSQQNYVEFGPPMPLPPAPPPPQHFLSAENSLVVLYVALGLAACAGMAVVYSEWHTPGGILPFAGLCQACQGEASTPPEYMGFQFLGSVFATSTPSKASSHSWEERSEFGGAVVGGSSVVGGYIQNLISRQDAKSKPHPGSQTSKTYSQMAKEKLKSQYTLLKEINA